MGPNLIFDKSLLQSLNIDESVWLDMFFYTNITPLFFIETLADLEKEVHKGRTPEEVVGNLADKTPDMYSVPNVHHKTLLHGELLGLQAIDTKTGRPIVSRGRQTELNGQKGVVIQETPESEAFNRWMKREFLDIERQHAKNWRQSISQISPEKDRALFSKWFGSRRPANMQQVKLLVDSVIDKVDIKESLKFGLALFGINFDAQAHVIGRWERAGQPKLVDFAPYFRHCLWCRIVFLSQFGSRLDFYTSNK